MGPTLEELGQKIPKLLNQWVAVTRGGRTEFLLDENQEVIATSDQNIIDIQLKVSELYPDLYAKRKVYYFYFSEMRAQNLQKPSLH